MTPSSGDEMTRETPPGGRIRLPETITACLFDLDGVLTHTAKVHAEAWKEMFDAYLKARDGDDFRPFDIATDYVQYVDGRLRQDGVRGFLESRGIDLPEGSPDDSPEEETINGLGNRKNARVVELIRTKGVETFPGSVRFLEVAREAGFRCAVVSASKNTPEVLRVTGWRTSSTCASTGTSPPSAACPASRNRIRSLPPPLISASSRSVAWCSRMRRLASRPGAPGSSAWLWGWTALARPRRCASMALTLSSMT